MNENEELKQTEQKKSEKGFSKSETIILVIISLFIGLSIGVLVNNTKLVKANIINDDNLQEFVNNYKYIIENYYEDVDRKKLINSAIAGMMESLDDPYSMYFDEQESDNFSITLDGSYKGIGIEISKDEETGYMLVATVFKNSPAHESGIQAGDYITSIDGKDVTDMEASELSDFIRNGDKDSFLLKILRDGKTIEINLKKTTVNLSSVASETYEVDSKKIGYIYIGIFANNTYEQFKNELSKLEKDGIDSLIIDVRGNTGGHLTAVDSILDLFLNSDHIMYQFEQNSKITSVRGTGNDSKEYDIVLLGDSVSASASEMLIAGLKENLNATFIGVKTFGKGTVQKLVNLSDGTQYKITVKKWLTPKGNWINDTKGIEPDVEVKLDDKYYETYDEKDDNQLQKALEYLKNKN